MNRRRHEELDYHATKAAMRKVGVDWPNIHKPSRAEKVFAVLAIVVCSALAVLGLYVNR